jgi:membrane dipeptidase
MIVDAHSDLPMHVVRKRETGQRHTIERCFHDQIVRGNVNVIVSAIFVEDRFLPEMALTEGLKQAASMKADIEESPDKLSLCTTYPEIERACTEGKTAFILALEGVEPIGQDLDLLRVFYDLGVRICGVSWSRRNLAADGCGFEREERSIKGGLTDFGRQLVTYAEELGMIIDVTHLSEAAFWDTVSIVKGPVIASHSNTQGILNIKRNLSDEQIKAIAGLNGVIGINGVSCLAVPIGRENSLSYLIDHIDHVKTLVGIDHVGIGLDLYTSLMNPGAVITIEQDGVRREVVDLVPGYPHLHTIVEGLEQRGYKAEEIDKVMGANFLRVFQQLK